MVRMYKVEFSKQAAKVYLKLPIHFRQQVDIKLRLLAELPYAKNNNINPIKGITKCYRLRIGDWRIIYEIINETLKIYIIKIGQRKEVYRS